MRVLILMDNATLAVLKNGEPPLAAFSHDKNLFQFAHETLRKGGVVFLTSIQDHPVTRPYYEVSSAYPFWNMSDTATDYADVAPDIVVAVFLEAMNIRAYFPHPKIVAIQAAVHWTESPDNFRSWYLFDTITAIRYNVDFVITQNERMKNILDVFFRFIAQTQITDRILVSPLGIVDEERRELYDREATRRAMGLLEGEIAIINSGGVWKWTDFNSFLLAFCEFCAEGNSPFKLFIMGFQQPENAEHTDYISETKSILRRYRALVGKNIIVEDDWYKASRDVKRFTSAADIGLNVSRPSLENWQSYRLRFLDYLYFGLPAINTMGDEVADKGVCEGLFTVRSGDIQSYKDVLQAICDSPGVVEQRRNAMRAFAANYDSRETYGKVIDRIVDMPRREIDDHAAWPETVLDFASRRAIEEGKHRLADRLGDLMMP